VEVMKVFLRKNQPASLKTATGGIVGERSMWAEVGERQTVEYTSEVYPGLWVAGMTATATLGTFRMGPVFGGMMLSGDKVARLINDRLAG
jgi:ribulose 1,5-bisphosphate synthetase/thiazole synthase